MLRDKGVYEFVSAANMLKSRGVTARFWLVGETDVGNPTSVSKRELEKWREDAVVEILGFRADMCHVLAQASIVVLPSYREGLPKVLIEAAACGRAVVTTDVPGCRDAIEPGITGLLVPPKDSLLLANAIVSLLDNASLRDSMGSAGRKLAEKKFSIEIVTSSHMSVYRALVDAAT